MKTTVKQWFGLKSLSSPRPLKELTLSKNELISLVKNIEFRSVRNHLQN